MLNFENKEQLKKIDPKDMLGLIMGFPGQCRAAAALAEAAKIAKVKKPAQIIFTGLGGSAIGADLIRAYLSGGKAIPIFVNRDYTLPDFAGKDTLLFACSYSGNTEETLAAYREAGRRRCPRIVISSGGKLSRLATRDCVSWIKIPAGMPPRAALGYSFFVPLMLLAKLRLIPSPRAAVRETIKNLERLRDEQIRPAIKTRNNPAKQIAARIHSHFPIIYGASRQIDVIVTRWRGQLAENAKWLASSHVLPEMNHNEIVGWENPRGLLKKFLVIMLRDKGEHPRVRKRMEITKSIIKREAKDVIEVFSQGKNLLSRIFSLVYMGDMVSFYLAMLNNVDPTPVKRIDYLKAKLKK